MPNHSVDIETNKNSKSKVVIKKGVVTFENLVNKYPKELIVHLDPVSKKDIFSDHCAINVSQALYDNGILLKAFKGVRCWQCPESSRIHAIRAQELADYLDQQPFAGCQKTLKMKGSEYQKLLGEKTGIIFFRDYWQRAGESGRTGDHIDLWDQGTLLSNGTVVSFLRQVLPDLAETFDLSDLERSSSVWFWEIE